MKVRGRFVIVSSSPVRHIAKLAFAAFKPEAPRQLLLMAHGRVAWSTRLSPRVVPSWRFQYPSGALAVELNLRWLTARSVEALAHLPEPGGEVPVALDLLPPGAARQVSDL